MASTAEIHVLVFQIVGPAPTNLWCAVITVAPSWSY